MAHAVRARPGNSLKSVNIKRELEEQKKTLFSLTPEEQVEEVIRNLMARELVSIKANVTFELDHNFVNGIRFLNAINPIFEMPKNWLIEKCLKDEDYRIRIYKRIDDVLVKTQGWRTV